MKAAKEGLHDCLRLLLKRTPKEHVHAVDNRGMTALMYASVEGHAGCCSLLLDFHEPDVQVNATDDDGEIEYTNSRGIQIKKDRGGWTAMMWAAKANNVECIKKLMLYGSPWPENNEMVVDIIIPIVHETFAEARRNPPNSSFNQKIVNAVSLLRGPHA